MNKKLIFLILFFAILTIPAVSLATPNTLQDVIDSLVEQLVPLSTGLATIAFIVAGIMFLTATGNPSRMAIGKGALIAAVIGVVIILLAETADSFIGTLFGF